MDSVILKIKAHDIFSMPKGCVKYTTTVSQQSSCGVHNSNIMKTPINVQKALGCSMSMTIT